MGARTFDHGNTKTTPVFSHRYEAAFISVQTRGTPGGLTTDDLVSSWFHACIVSSKTKSLTEYFPIKGAATSKYISHQQPASSITKPSKTNSYQSSLFKMIYSKLLSLSTLAFLPLSLAAPASAPEPLSAATAAIEWTPINFEGKTLYINSAAVAMSANPTEEAKQALRMGDAPDSDTCDGTTLDPHPPPFANTADCAVIRDWTRTQNTYWGVWDNTPDTHGVLYYGTCVFEAGTRNIQTTWIGSSNIADITMLALNRWQSGGVVASQGQTECDNNGIGTSTVRWTIKHS
ncbi:hypothetical protein OPT61_g4194 [Boeremia exigua]|uniref:Uncharacterized protein n=1 Tax=Boeremia exigua TaxID=749465 RepID=A0ACC2IF71_9PLEO|nr:hypothetical protein OPT61_g4194 [Boeremia exigua]